MADGWPTYTVPAGASLVYHESVEISELKLPLQFDHIKLIPGTAGAGRFRGSPATNLAYGPRELPMEVIWPCDGTVFPPKGVRGGHDGICSQHWKVRADGVQEELPNMAWVTLKKGELVRGHSASGAGYGEPLDRDPQLVLNDVLEGYESLERAANVYGVRFSGSLDDDSLALDVEGTARQRRELALSPRSASSPLKLQEVRSK